MLVGVKDGRIVATQGDPDAPVNKGLNCVKGYFLAKLQYGKDRLTTPLLRMKDGKFDKNGEFAPVSWKQAFDIMEEKVKATLKAKGPTAVGMFGSGQWTIWEGYAAVKLFKAGFRSNNIDPNARHCMASTVAGFMRTFGIDDRWAATTASAPMPSCCGAPTWRNTRSSVAHRNRRQSAARAGSRAVRNYHRAANGRR